MNEFTFKTPDSANEAVRLNVAGPSRFLAGGTTLLDLMKCNVETPQQLVDISRLTTLREININSGTLRVGALVRMSELAAHPDCQRQAPAIYESLWQAASPQIRNMATIGGNLRQRTRCAYFRDPETFPACNKRHPGSGCSAIDGINNGHAILGASEACVAVYPGDLAVALTAFQAQVILRNAQQQERRVPVEKFYLLPRDTPDQEHDIADDEMIVAVEVPLTPALVQSHYLKVRDRASYEFAAASAAVGLEMQGETIKDVHIALGGVATIPWRAYEVEEALRGKTLNETLIRQAAERAVTNARALSHNHARIILVPRVISRALLSVGKLT
ncbi:MAG: xanthine dehydrogenase family protein subunit M [Enterobacterales bacterium endosymbiont of Blomia tropicalis]|uniref:FAD binding domain-containing protein n=1 Tax=Mixta mediterraneensis TaxID=2758443 RepID=UPI0025A72AB5|nr:xanthine dehydrogenase family protein subunit M [Mixta mediterraneensis]MDL4912517.1 xanthine dehydrogenase family protein subunit M [Mixta mediterraneensis]